MVKKAPHIRYLAVTFALSFLFCPAAQAKGRPVDKKQLAETMSKVRKGEISTLRTDAAEHLAELTRRVDPNSVDDATLAEMISLPNTSEDSVRFWVAASLGNLGPHAKAAIPALLKLLPEVDCHREI